MSRFKRYRYVFSGMFFDVGYTCFGSCFSLGSRGRIDALSGVQGLLHGPVGKCAWVGLGVGLSSRNPYQASQQFHCQNL